jgi:broad specificity phosphatase PhoE
MADTLIYLIRHGETEYNRLDRIQGRGIDAPLNEAGERQAREVGAWLNTANVDVAVSSSLLRARQTAAIAMGMALNEIEAIADLDELSYGAMEGIPVNEQSGALADLYDAWARGELQIPPPDGETPIQVFERASGAVHRLIDAYPGKTLAVFTHGRTLRILVSGLIGLGLRNMRDIPHQNGCIYKLRHDGDRIHLDIKNHIDHLTEPHFHV